MALIDVPAGVTDKLERDLLSRMGVRECPRRSACFVHDSFLHVSQTPRV